MNLELKYEPIVELSFELGIINAISLGRNMIALKEFFQFKFRRS